MKNGIQLNDFIYVELGTINYNMKLFWYNFNEVICAYLIQSLLFVDNKFLSHIKN